MRITSGFAPDVIDVNVKNATGTIMAAGTVVYFNADGLTITTVSNDWQAGTLLTDVLPNGGIGLARKMGPYGGSYLPLSGSGGSSSSGLAQITATRNTVTEIEFNADAATAPISIGVGNTAYQFTTPATLTITAGTGSGNVLVYFDTISGALIAGHNIAATTLVGSGITVATAVTVVPVTAIPLYTLEVVSGNWVTIAATANKQGLNSGKYLIAGDNVTLTDLGNSVEIDVAATAPNPKVYRSVIVAQTAAPLASNILLTYTFPSGVVEAGDTIKVDCFMRSVSSATGNVVPSLLGSSGSIDAFDSGIIGAQALAANENAVMSLIFFIESTSVIWARSDFQRINNATANLSTTRGNRIASAFTLGLTPTIQVTIAAVTGTLGGNMTVTLYKAANVT